MIFIDTNYLLRFILGDNPVQSREVADFFISSLKNRTPLCTDTTVLFEVYWVLKKYYRIKPEDIYEALIKIYHIDIIDIPDREIFLNAITNFHKFNYDLEDAYHFYYAQSKNVTNIATYDKNLIKKFK